MFEFDLGLGLAGFIFFSLASMFGILSGSCLFQEIAQVNRKLPDDKQISYWGFYPGKMWTIKEKYDSFYPNGRLDFWRRAFQNAGFVFMGLVVLVVVPPFKNMWKSLHHGGTFLPMDY
jgi:hypothetical protein